ncbi:MAG TPA: hypothetical protein VG052_04955 [Puia sp.]|nr:hypothetical protein [Puia sp.]
MQRLLFYLVFLAALGCCGLDCRGQVSDTATRRLSIWERRRRVLEERLQEHQERMEAWEKRPLLEADKPNKWNLSFNTFGLLEPQMAIGVGVGYQVTNCWQIWLESSGLCQFYQKPAQSCLGGVRETLAMKFYFGPRQSVFFAAEFRWKQVYYHDVANFENPDTRVDLKNYTYKLENIIFGGAVWFGGRIRISDNHRWRLEPSIGMGLKARTVVWQGVPQGFGYEHTGAIDLNPFSTSPRVSTPVTFYLPASLRLVYVL